MNSFRFAGLYLLLLITSCQTKQKDILVIDMDNPKGSIDISISDLLDDITIVPLETRDDLLLSTEGMYFTVSDHYILVQTRDKLLQYDRQGNYIRTLAVKGNGPDEFNVIMDLQVSEKQDFIYYTSSMFPNSFTGINLTTGTFQTFPKPDLQSFSMRQTDAQGNIYGFPSTAIRRIEGSTAGSDSLLLAYRYNPIEQTTTVFEGHHGFPSESAQIEMMFKQGDQIFFCVPAYSDTLFKIEGDKISPQYVMTVKNPLIDRIEGGISIHPLISTTRATLFQKWYRQVSIGERSVNVRNDLLAYLFLNETYELHWLKSVIIEPLALTIDLVDYITRTNEKSGVEVPIYPLPSVSGAWGYFAVEAYNMLELIDVALKGNHLSAVQCKTLENIASRIDKESNPVLIIGKIK